MPAVALHSKREKAKVNLFQIARMICIGKFLYWIHANLKILTLFQACFFNVLLPTAANKFAEILSLAKNSLSLAGIFLSLAENLLSLAKKILEFKKIP